MMSLDEAVGRIQSIMSMERAMANPVAYQQALAASPAVTATGTAGGSSFSDQLNSALVSGTGAGSSLTSGGAAVSGGDSRVQAMVSMADSLVGKPYVWGGGHSGWATQSGYDCSGFVSAVLHAGGYLSQPADTTTLPSQPGIASGPGQHVTIYDRDGAGQGAGHVIIEIDGQFYESGGESGAWGGGGGVEKINRPSDSYLATFDRVLHPEGL
jgi:cell wall-associated NlpC family hydrolase